MNIVELSAIEYGNEKASKPFSIYINPMSLYDFQEDDYGKGTWVYSAGYPDGVLVTEKPLDIVELFSEAMRKD